MTGTPQRLRDEQEIAEFAVDHDELHAEITPESTDLTNANDARRRLEDYWAQKALEEELKNIDDWDDAD